MTTNTARLRIGTANIKNFPDMADPLVRADAKESGDATDLLLLQEIAEREDKAAVDAMLPGFTTDHATECSLAARNTLLRPLGKAEVVLLGKGLGPGRFSPDRHMVRRTYELVGTDLPPIEAMSVHYVQAAWSTRAVWNRPLRQRNWVAQHGVAGRYVLEALASGRIVVAGGDFNRNGTDAPLWHPSQQWVVGGKGGIDHVALLLPPNVKATMVGAQVTRDLHSDHELKVRTVELVNTTPAKPAVSPGWDAIYEAAAATLANTPRDATKRRADLAVIMTKAAAWSVNH